MLTIDGGAHARAPFGPRTRYLTLFADLADGLEQACRELTSGNVCRSLDICEQLIDAYPESAVKILLAVHTLIGTIESQDRYTLYQSRFFNFGIRHEDKVLDIGSGNVPFPGATHLADLTLSDDGFGRAGCAFKTLAGRNVYECDIERMPFADREFDFVYCSHVLEHVDHPEKACNEIMRVGKRGYIEVPTRGKDLFLNTAGKSNHRWGIDVFGNRMVFSQYSPDEAKGTGCEVLMDMHCAPTSDRERAFSALLTLRADLFNGMLLWDRAFDLEVRRRPLPQPTSPAVGGVCCQTAPAAAEAPAARGPESSAIPSAGGPDRRPLKFMLVHTFYEPYLKELYASRPQLERATYAQQMDALIADGFGAIHTYTPYLEALGYRTLLTVANNLASQARWLVESGVQLPVGAGQKEIVALQIERFRPDVLYLGNPLEFDAAFVKRLSFRPRLVVGWRAASIPAGSDLSHLGLILSHLSVCRRQAVALGAGAAEPFAPGVPSFIADAVKDEPKRFDVVFSGQWTAQHGRRNAVIQRVAEEAAKGTFTLGLFLAAPNPSALPAVVSRFNQGPRWGMAMYRALKSGRVVLNAEIDLAAGEAGNMRLFETTGVGAFLLTEYQPNILRYFTPGEEIDTFADPEELLQKISRYLGDAPLREKIAARGLDRCLTEHGMTARAAELDRIIRAYLGSEKKEPGPATSGETMEDPYDRAYQWGWNHPELRRIVYLCYKTPDFADNARRFYGSDEFNETVRVLGSLGKPPDRATTVLDIGCGNGVACYALARRGYSVVGIDSSNGKLAGIEAARRLQDLDGAQFELVHAEADRIECEDGSFDVIWMREVLHHIKDLRGFLAEAMRVLKPGGVICCLRDTVVWNENQRDSFLSTHPFNHITRDEGCHTLKEYTEAFAAVGFEAQRVLTPVDSVINTYPAPFVPGRQYDPRAASLRQSGYDLFSFFYRKPDVKPEATKGRPADGGQEAGAASAPREEGLAARFGDVSWGANVQVIGMGNLQIGAGSCIGDNVWLNVCVRDDRVRMKIGKCVLVGRQSVVSTAGFLEIGDYSVLAPRVYVADADHQFRDIGQPVMQQGVTQGRSVVVEENCWLGINAVITGSLTIGRGSVVAANAVVTRDVPPFSVVAGNPAVVVRMYNPLTKAWERTDTPEARERVISARKEAGIPERDPYRKNLEQAAVFKRIEPIVAGRNVNI